MIRSSLALILLFIAPSAWGQNHTMTIIVPDCMVGPNGKLIPCEAACVDPPDPNSKLPACGHLERYRTELPKCKPGYFIGKLGINGFECWKAEDIPHEEPNAK